MLEICNAISIIGFGAPCSSEGTELVSDRSGSSGKHLHACLGAPGRLAARGTNIWAFRSASSLSLSQQLTSLSLFPVAGGWIFSIGSILSIQSSRGVTLFSKCEGPPLCDLILFAFLDFSASVHQCSPFPGPPGILGAPAIVKAPHPPHHYLP